MRWSERDVATFARDLRRGDPSRTRTELAASDLPDAAELVKALPHATRHVALSGLEPDRAADLLESMPSDIAAEIVSQLSPSDAAPIVRAMKSDDEADVLQRLPPEHTDAILARIAPEEASAARTLIAYGDHSAGGLMQTEFISVTEDTLVGDVVRDLRAGAERFADYPVSYLYVVDGDGQLCGIASLRSLLLCDATTSVVEIAATNVVAAEADLPGVDLVKLFRRHRFLAIPVVDERDRLLGVVTHDDAMRFAEEDADEEMLRLAGIAGGDEFRDMPFRRRASGRLSWLSVNVALNVAAASVIAIYQETLEAVIALAVFLPIISDMSGCSGNQAVAVSIRELSVDRIRPANFLWVLRKELMVGVANGLVLGVLVGVVAWLWKDNAVLGAVVGGALWVNTLVAVSIGGLTPLLLRRMGRDPAIASSPILTTLTDMCGFFFVLAAATLSIDYL